MILTRANIKRIIKDMNQSYRLFAFRYSWQASASSMVPGGARFIQHYKAKMEHSREQMDFYEHYYVSLIESQLGSARLMQMKLADKLGYPFDDSIFE